MHYAILDYKPAYQQTPQSFPPLHDNLQDIKTESHVHYAISDYKPAYQQTPQSFPPLHDNPQCVWMSSVIRYLKGSQYQASDFPDGS